MDSRLHIPLFTVPPQYQQQNNQQAQQMNMQLIQQQRQYHYVYQQQEKYNLAVFPNQSHHILYHNQFQQGHNQPGASYPPYHISGNASQPMNSPFVQVYTPQFQNNNENQMRQMVAQQFQNNPQNFNKNWFNGMQPSENFINDNSSKNNPDGTARFQVNNGNNVENNWNVFQGNMSNSNIQNSSNIFENTKNQQASPAGNITNNINNHIQTQGSFSSLQGDLNSQQGNIINSSGSKNTQKSSSPQARNHQERKKHGKKQEIYQKKGEFDEKEMPSPVLLVMIFELHEHEATNDLIQSVFVKFGFVNKVLIFKRSPEQTQAFIEMDSVDSALNAKKALNKTKIKLFQSVNKAFKLKVHFSQTAHLNLCNYKTEGADYREQKNNLGKQKEQNFDVPNLAGQIQSLALNEKTDEMLNSSGLSQHQNFPRTNQGFGQSTLGSNLPQPYLVPIQPPTAASYLAKTVLSSDDEITSSGNNSKENSLQPSPKLRFDNTARPREVSIFCCDDKNRELKVNHRLINAHHPNSHPNQDSSTILLQSKLESCESLNQIQEQFSSQSLHNLSEHENSQQIQSQQQQPLQQQQQQQQQQSSPLSYVVKLQQQQLSQQQSQSASSSSIPVSLQQLQRNPTLDSFQDRNKSTCSTLSPCSFPLPNSQSSYAISNKLEYLHLSSAAESSLSPIPKQPSLQQPSCLHLAPTPASNFLDNNQTPSNSNNSSANNEEISMMQGISSLSLSEEPSSLGATNENSLTQESPVIYIKNASIDELRPENIYNIFRNFGYVHSILFMKENSTVLIQYEEANQAKMAINQLNNVFFLGSEPLRISFAKRKAISIPPNLLNNNESPSQSSFMQQQPQAYPRSQHAFNNSNQILNMVTSQRSSDYFLNKNKDPRSKVVSQSKKNSFYNPASRTVYVTNIPIQLVQNKQDFIELFSYYGSVTKNSISISDMRVTALIEFDSLQTALKSICFLHNSQHYGKLIQIFFTRTTLNY